MSISEQGDLKSYTAQKLYTAQKRSMEYGQKAQDAFDHPSQYSPGYLERMIAMTNMYSLMAVALKED